MAPGMVTSHTQIKSSLGVINLSFIVFLAVDVDVGLITVINLNDLFIENS